MKRLYLAKHNKVLFGVAGGMAEYFNVDVALVRLAWVLLGLSGPGVIAYIIAAIVIPPAPASVSFTDGESAAADDREEVIDVKSAEHSRTAGAGSGMNGYRLLATFFVLFGIFLLLDELMPAWRWDRFWPLGLVALGAYMLIARKE